jgi:Flavin reductase like domain
MEIDFAELTAYHRYKLMASLIVPRPIALVTTLGENDVANAAPFSMFNMLGEDPPIVMLSINRLQDGRLKDTAANILASGEFVVHLCERARGPGRPRELARAAAGLPPGRPLRRELLRHHARPLRHRRHARRIAQHADRRDLSAAVAQCSLTRGSVLRVSSREAEPSAVFHQPCSATWCIL